MLGKRVHIFGIGNGRIINSRWLPLTRATGEEGYVYTIQLDDRTETPSDFFYCRAWEFKLIN